MTPVDFRKFVVSAANFAMNGPYSAWRHEMGCKILAEIDLLVVRIGENFLRGLVPNLGDGGRQAFGPGQSAEFRQRDVITRFCDGRDIGKRRHSNRIEGRQHAHFVRFILGADLGHFAHAHVERAVQHIDHHVAAAFVAYDRGIHFGCDLQLLRRLALQRSRIGSAPATTSGPGVVDQILQRFVRAFGPNIEDFRIVEEVHHRLKIAIGVRGMAEKRGQNVGRRGCVEHAAVRLGGGDARNRLGAGTALVVFHDKGRIDIFLRDTAPTRAGRRRCRRPGSNA